MDRWSHSAAPRDDGHICGGDDAAVGLGSWDLGNDGVVMSPWWFAAEMVFPRWHGGYFLV